MTDHEPSDETVEQAMDEFTQITNSKVVANALSELDRVDVTDLSRDESVAYSDALTGLAWLQESLSEPEKRRPNAQVQPWGSPDDD